MPDAQKRPTAAEKKMAEREGESAKAAETLERSAAEAQAPALPEVEDAGRDENVGKVRGRDIDPTFPTVLFTDPQTGEVIENVPTVHEVAVGTNKDGSPKMERADKVFFVQTDAKK